MPSRFKQQWLPGRQKTLQRNARRAFHQHLGALASAVGFALPKPVMGTVSLLADPASPVALFTIGAVLARSQMNSVSRTPFVRYVPVALIKLIVHPLLVGGVGLGAIALGVCRWTALPHFVIHNFFLF